MIKQLLNHMFIAICNAAVFSRACTHLSELANEVENGAEKIITKNGEPAVAMIHAKRLAHYRQLERANVHLLIAAEVEKRWADVEAGRAKGAYQRFSACGKSARMRLTLMLWFCRANHDVQTGKDSLHH